MSIIRVWLTLTLVVSPTGSFVGRALENLSVNGQHAVQCMIPPAGELRQFLAPTSSADVPLRVHEGGIPHTSQVELNEKIINVVFYSPNGRKAVVRTAYIATSGQVEVSSTPWFLTRSDHKWVVTDGEGGPGTFKRVAEFVDSLQSLPLQKAKPESKMPEWCK